jgi:hypothetical protein
VRVEETESWQEGSELWRVMRTYFPGSIETHSLVQDFFFGDDLMLRRHDYNVNSAGGFGAAQLTSDYVVANGIRLPAKRRAHARGPDRRQSNVWRHCARLSTLCTYLAPLHRRTTHDFSADAIASTRDPLAEFRLGDQQCPQPIGGMIKASTVSCAHASTNDQCFQFRLVAIHVDRV